MKKEKQKLKYNIHYRAMWGFFKSDKWKKKLLLIAELTDIVRDLYHPSITRKEIIEVKNFIKNKIYSDGHEQLKPLTQKQMKDWYSMNHREFMEKWRDKL